MRRILLIGLGLALCLAQAAAAAPRVVLVGVDGAGWPVIDGLLVEGKLPNLAALAKRGVQARLETVEPVISPVVWTSMATGQPPAVHGIGDFFADARDMQVPSIFERLSVQGLRVGTYEWLVTWPPRALPGGFVIPDWLRRDPAMTPADAFERAGVSDYRYSIRAASTRQDFHRVAFRELAEKAAHWNALAKAFELEAGAVSFYAIDALSHRFWADAYPGEFASGEAPAPEAQYAAAIPDAYVGFDCALGEIVAALPEETAVLVASDHGFEARDGWERVWTFPFDGVLAEAGFAPGRDAFEIEGQFGFVVLRVLPGPLEAREKLLEQLVAFLAGATTQDGEPLLSIVRLDAIERPPGHERGWLDRAEQWFWRTAARLAFSVEFSEEAYAWVVARPNDAAIERAVQENKLVMAGKTRPADQVVFGDGFTGGHHPEAVFIAAGGPLRHEAERGDLHVFDVAPLFAYLAGAKVPDDLPGTLPERWIDPEVLEANPPRAVEAASLPRLPAPEAPAIPDAEVLERLRAMGYVE